MSEYTEIASSLKDSLVSVVGENRFFQGATVKPDLAHDEKAMYGVGMPDVAVEVTSTDEVSEVLRLCNNNKLPVTVRGAGTGLCGGSVAVDGGLMLCTSRMNKILELNEEDMTITVQPAVSLQEVMDAAAEKGLCYPPDPGEKTASIGGNVSTNASGPRAAHFGTTRNYVLSCIAVLPTGEIVKLGAPVIKSAVGPDLLQLVIGSEGTLAVVTEITLKLVPKKKFDISFILPYEGIEEAMNASMAIVKSGLEPVNMELMPQEIITFSANFTGEHLFPEDAGACLLVTFETVFEDWLDMIMEQFAEIAEETGPADILVVDTPTLKRDMWAAHAALQTSIESSIKRFDESDVILPVSKVVEYIESIGILAESLSLSLQTYGHAGDGSLHIFVYNDDLPGEVFTEKTEAFMNISYNKCVEMGGSISGEHGIGRGKKAYLEAALGEDLTELMRRVKAAFDPNGILNPGKVVD